MASYPVGQHGFLFVEATAFSVAVKDLLDDETYRLFQNELAGNPTKGVVMPGCGGLRKIRVEAPRRGKGKRGGFRIIYMYIPELMRIDLLAIYGKDKQDDLSSDQQRILKALADRARMEALAAKGFKEGK